MKQERLNIHYETLYEIIDNRYKGLTPDSIKNKLINSDVDFEIETPKSNSSKTLEEKKTEYIRSEVGRALNVLTKNAKSIQELEDYDDTFYFSDDVDDKQREDYKFYPNSLIIGEAKILNNNKVSSRNGTYRLNHNIKFSITDREDLRISAKYLYMLFTVEKEHDVNDSMVLYVTQAKKIITDEKDFTKLIDTFVQLNMHEIYMPNKQYTLDILLTLISLGTNINIDIKNEKSTFSLRNIVMNELIFDIDKFQIVCDGMSLTINDMKDIKLIESASENSISDNISQLQNSLVNYPNEIQDYFKKKIENFKTVNQIFSQEY